MLATYLLFSPMGFEITPPSRGEAWNHLHCLLAMHLILRGWQFLFFQHSIGLFRSADMEKYRKEVSCYSSHFCALISGHLWCVTQHTAGGVDTAHELVWVDLRVGLLSSLWVRVVPENFFSCHWQGDIAALPTVVQAILSLSLSLTCMAN